MVLTRELPNTRTPKLFNVENLKSKRYGLDIAACRAVQF